jgi:hypothetical protein
MKGVVLTLCGFVLGAASSWAAGNDVEFGVTNNDFSRRADPALILRTPKPADEVSARLVTDSRSEVRGARPSVAYTVFRLRSRLADVSLQPVLGRINGAQLHLDF